MNTVPAQGEGEFECFCTRNSCIPLWKEERRSIWGLSSASLTQGLAPVRPTTFLLRVSRDTDRAAPSGVSAFQSFDRRSIPELRSS